MKKFTKILIALGAAGIAKYIYDHVDIYTNKELEEKIKKEAEVIAKEKACNNVLDGVDKHTVDGAIDDLNKKILNSDEHSGHYTIGFCDHVYYDNPYNINKIYLDKTGCPHIFEFENVDDRNQAMTACYNFFKDVKCKINMLEIFNVLGLIIDDYFGFEDHFVIWDPVDFIFVNGENALQNTINLGDFMIEDDF